MNARVRESVLDCPRPFSETQTLFLAFKFFFAGEISKKALICSSSTLKWLARLSYKGGEERRTQRSQFRLLEQTLFPKHERLTGLPAHRASHHCER